MITNSHRSSQLQHKRAAQLQVDLSVSGSTPANSYELMTCAPAKRLFTLTLCLSWALIWRVPFVFPCTFSAALPGAFASPTPWHPSRPELQTNTIKLVRTATIMFLSSFVPQILFELLFVFTHRRFHLLSRTKLNFWRTCSQTAMLTVEGTNSQTHRHTSPNKTSNIRKVLRKRGTRRSPFSWSKYCSTVQVKDKSTKVHCEKEKREQ